MPSKNYCKPPRHLYQSFRRRSCDVRNREPCSVQPHDRKKCSTAPVLEQSEQRASAGGGGLHLMHVDLDSLPMALINTTVDPGINLKNCPSGKACGKFCRISKEVHSPNNPVEEITRSDIVEGGKKLGLVDGGGVPVRVALLPPNKKEGGHSQKGVGCETKNYRYRKNRSSSNHRSTSCSPPNQVWERVDSNQHPHQRFGLSFHLPPLACSYLLPTPMNAVPLNTFPPPSVRMQMKQPAGSHTPHHNALPPPHYQQIPPHPSFSRPFTFQRSLHFMPSPGSSGTCEPMGVMPHNMRDLRMFSVPPPLTGAAGIGNVGASGLAQFREQQQQLPASRGFVGGDVPLPFQPPANLLQQYDNALVSPYNHVESVPSRSSEAERFSALSSEIWSLYVSSRESQQRTKEKLQLQQFWDNAFCAHFRGRFPHGCRLVLVGSSVNGFGLDTSDADMCLIVSDSPIDQRDWAPLILTEVMLVLHSNLDRPVRGLVYVPAKIPLVKFTDVRTGIEVDVNCNNTVGLLNTRLLRAYADLDWRVRPLVVLVKLWAQRNSINDARCMTISSYSLVLMLIHYLQCGVSPAVLPSLQRKLPDQFRGSDCHVHKLDVHEELLMKRTENTLSLGDLFAGFLDYFANRFQYDRHAISVRLGTLLSVEDIRVASPAAAAATLSTNATGGGGGCAGVTATVPALPVPLSSSVTPAPAFDKTQLALSCQSHHHQQQQPPQQSSGCGDAHEWNFLCVEEPFMLTNTARSVYDEAAFERIRSVFRKSFVTLVRDRSLSPLLNGSLEPQLAVAAYDVRVPIPVSQFGFSATLSRVKPIGVGSSSPSLTGNDDAEEKEEEEEVGNKMKCEPAAYDSCQRAMGTARCIPAAWHRKIRRRISEQDHRRSSSVTHWR